MGEKINAVASHPLDDMNDVLARREEIFLQREEQIEKRMTELKAYEARILEGASQLKKDKEDFKKIVEKETLKFSEMQKEIDAQWLKIHEYEEQCKRSMERVIEEQVKLQEKDNVQLEESLKKEQAEITKTSSALDDLMVSLDMGSIVPNFGTMETDEPIDKKEADVETDFMQETIADKEQPTKQILEKNDNLQTLLKAFEDSVKNVFPKAFVNETTSERFCFTIGKRKVRVFTTDDVPTVHILEQRNSSKKMLQDIVQLNRVQSLWEFAYEDNYFISRMAFSQTTPVETVLMQCKTVMEEYF